MHIKTLTIDEYGPFKAREFSLSEGLNIVEGNNESGKSTILAFIRFMLYGMPRKSAGVTDRDRGISWDGGVAGGSMVLSVQGKDGTPHEYRIERHGQMRGATGHENYSESLKIIDLATGTEVFEGQEPGRALLGLSPETFVSTACIRQLECTDVDGTGVNASIENLLFAANEGINTEKATGKLDELRKVLLHKNEKGGEIYELEEQRLALEEKLTHAKETSESIVSKESAVEALGILENEIGIKIRECENAVKLYENCTVLCRFDELHQKENEFDALMQELTELDEHKGFDGPLPDRERIAEVETLLRSLSDASANAAMSDAELAKAQNAADGDRSLASLAETVENNGGRETLEAEFKRLTKKQSRSKKAAVAAFVGGGILLLVGLLAIALGLSAQAPLFGVALLKTVADFVLPLVGSALLLDVIGGGLTAVGVALVVWGILLAKAVKSAKLSRAALVSKLSLSDAEITVESFSAHISACLDNHGRCTSHDEGVKLASATSASRYETLNQCVTECASVLTSLNVAHDPSSVENVTDALRNAIRILSEICREKERLENELGKLQTVIMSMSETLNGYSENTLRSVIGSKIPSEVVAHTDIDKVETTRRYFKEQLAAATSKRIGMEKELIALTAAAENPTKLAIKLEEIETALREKRFQYQAIVTAMEAIDSASESLRRSVTPRVRQKAGAFMGLITGGKYGELGVAADMSVSIFAGNSTRSIDVLSKGTRDAAYLSLRMALADLVSPGDPLPLTMDEGLSLLDEGRATRVLNLLHSYAQSGGQCVLFTCHKREGELMRNIGAFNHIMLH